MTKDPFDWVDEKEEEIKEERAKGYFDIVEGKQQFILLSHCAPLAQVYDKSTNKYRAAVEGDQAPSIKGVCWVLQSGFIKQAKLPYTLVKSIRALQQNPDWEFELPFPHTLTLDAEGAGTKEVKYSLTASPKKIEIPVAILEELKKKPAPEQIVEKIKDGKSSQRNSVQDEQEAQVDYPPIDPADTPF